MKFIAMFHSPGAPVGLFPTVRYHAMVLSPERLSITKARSSCPN